MRLIHIPLLAAVCLLCACGTKAEPETENDPPVLLSTDPANGVTDLIGSSVSIRFTFDQNIKCSPEGQSKISASGGAVIDKVDVYGTDVTVWVGSLEKGTSYTVSLPSGTVQGYRKNQKGSAPISFSFSTKKDDTPVSQYRMKPAKDDAGWENAALCLQNMGAGWNLGNTLDSNSGSLDNMWIEAWTKRTPADYETAWGQPVATRALIHMFKEAGFNSIRVPVTWYPHIGKVEVSIQSIGGESRGVWDPSTWTGYDVDPAWMARVKEVVDYVIDEGMYCILNVHHDTGAESAAWLRADSKVYADSRERYVKLWKQIATAFASYGEKLVFESFNEMLDVQSTWNDPQNNTAYDAINSYNADFVATVRSTGGNNARRNLILNTYAASPSEKTLRAFKLPADSVKDHLCAEVHSYAPYQFAMVDGSSQTKFNSSCEQEVTNIISLVGKILVDNGIPCVLGEYGATASREEAEKSKQAACYIKNACKYGIPCFYWMTLSDGADRSVPKWTSASLKDAIIKAYNDNK